MSKLTVIASEEAWEKGINQNSLAKVAAEHWYQDDLGKSINYTEERMHSKISLQWHKCGAYGLCFVLL
jgi:hypothetical protein